MTTFTRFSPRVNDFDVLVWLPDDFVPPTKEQREFLETWLKNGTERTMIYVGRDYDAAVTYWERVAPQVSPREADEALRSEEEDPEVLSQAELVSALAPRLKSLGAADGLSSKEEKDYARGIEEFLEKGRPEQTLSFLGKVVERDQTCVGCRSVLGLAELNWGDWYGANRDVTEVAVQSTGAREPARR